MVQPLKESRSSGPEEGSAARLKRLIGEQFTLIWRLLRRIGLTEVEADGAVEEVFSAASQRIADIRAGSERAFLFSTAVHVAARVRRGRGEQPAISDRAPALEDLDGSAQGREILAAVLEQMPLELRVVFVLHEIEALNEDDIAGMIGIPAQTVRSRLAEAKEDFATHLEADSELALSALAAAREERPMPAASARVLAATGVAARASEPVSRRGHSGSSALNSSSSSVVRPPRSLLGLSVKWLVLGWVVGLLSASVVYALAGSRAAGRGSAQRR